MPGSVSMMIFSESSPPLHSNMSSCIEPMDKKKKNIGGKNNNHTFVFYIYNISINNVI